MNIQRLSESLYHIWRLRLEGQVTFRHGTNPDYLPASLFEEVQQHTRIVEQELNTVFFSRAQAYRFDTAVNEIKFHMPYVKTINRSGLFIVPIVGNKEDVERRLSMVKSEITNPALKRKYIELMNKEFRNAF